MHNLLSLRKQLKSKSNPKRAKLLQGFFKTGKGEYAEGDVFLGLTSAQIKEVAYRHKDISIRDIEKLLKSKIHEERAAALRILIYQFQSVMRSHNIKDARQNNAMMHHSIKLWRNDAVIYHSALNDRQKIERDKQERAREIFNFYLKNTRYINNWDLVDLSASKIVGEYLNRCETTNSCESTNRFKSTNAYESTNTLYRLAESKNLWEKRIAIISTFAFIRQNQFEDTLKISKILLNDKHDLIHKAVGWMLREIGKRNLAQEEKFLKKHYKTMPRTMLRYAIEKFPEKKRKMYLLGKTC